VNAGTMPPLLRRGYGKVEPIGDDDSAGLPLGIDADTQYNSSTLPFSRGDFLTMFTDGISEAMNPDNKLYGTTASPPRSAAKSPTSAPSAAIILDDVKQSSPEDRRAMTCAWCASGENSVLITLRRDELAGWQWPAAVSRSTEVRAIFSLSLDGEGPGLRVLPPRVP